MKLNKIFLTAIFVLSFAAAQALFAQEKLTMSGFVKDVKGNPVPGAVVALHGTVSGTITDDKGHYILSIGKQEKEIVLDVSCLGYVSSTVSAKGRSRVDFVLDEDTQQLDEAVVVGYGAMRRSDLTGAVTSVKIDEGDAGKSASIDKLLQGHAAGVQVVNSSAAPDAAVSIRIRGISTFNSSTEPLYVVDGIILNTDSTMPMEETSIDNSNGLMGINPNDIASIEILKDASATAIYGSQASNGVVLITTKTATRVRPIVTFSAGLDVSTRYKTLPMLDASEYVAYQDIYEDSRKGYPYTQVTGRHSMYYNNVYDSYGNYIVEPINWQDYMLQTALSQRYYLSVAGKPKDINYMFSVGYKNAKGVIRTTGFQHYTMRMNLDYDVTPKIKLGTRTNVSYLISNLTQGASTGTLLNSSSFMRSMLACTPYRQINNSKDDDLFDMEDGGNTYSASPERWINDFQNAKTEFRVNPSLFLQYKILKWLTFKSTFGADYRVSEQNKFISRRINSGIDGSYAVITHMNRLNWNWDNVFMFNKRFKAHYISGTAGLVISRSAVTTESVTGKQLVEYKAQSNAINSSDNNVMLYNESSSSLMSFIARAIYNYKDRYVLTATYRLDGSSKFQGKNKWAHFPSMAFAWRMNQENWFDVPVISMFKLRVGWGRVGNQAISSYQTKANFSNKIWPDHTYGNASEGVVGIVPANLANKNLKWETTEQTNIGLDFGMWKGRFTLSVEAYYKLTRDLLQSKVISAASGYGTMWMNFGSIENKGVELTLGATPVKVGEFEWSLNGNISFNRNKILQIGSESEADYVYISPSEQKYCTYFYGQKLGWGTIACNPLNIFIEGQPMGQFYGYVTEGYVQEGETGVPNWAGVDGSPKPGTRKYKDLNADGKLDEKDRTIIGNPNPDFTYGFSTALSWKGLTLSVDFNGSYGNDVYNENRQLDTRNDAQSRMWNSYRGLLTDSWTPSKPVGTGFPKVGYTSDIEERNIYDVYVEDASFLRLANVSLSYDFRINNKKSVLRGVNVGFAASNLYVFTRYSGFDPEVNSHSSTRIMGADMGSYPGARTFSFDVKLTF